MENSTECWQAIEFECFKCGEVQYADDNLEHGEYNGCAVESDILDCESCGVENFVFRSV